MWINSINEGAMLCQQPYDLSVCCDFCGSFADRQPLRIDGSRMSCRHSVSAGAAGSSYKLPTEDYSHPSR
jgi:hypothetical protein